MGQLVSLIEDQDRLKFKLEGSTAHPIGPDFSSASQERFIADSKKRRPLVLKAILGAKYKGESLRVFDFCSGFGADAFVMAMNGLDVTSAEIHPEVARALTFNWEKDREVDWVKDVNPNLKFVASEGGKWLEENKVRFDVVYIDPMFEKLKDSAKSPLPMQILQELTHEFPMPSVQESFETARKWGAKVVVKLPLKGTKVISQNPSHSIEGKTIRFDVFV